MTKEQQLQKEIDKLLIMQTKETDKYLACIEFIQRIGLIEEFNEFLQRSVKQ